MIGWLFLAGAIATEVTATLALQASVKGSKLWYAVVGVGYVAAFVLLSFTLDAGVPLGVAYGIWSAIGVALTAVLGKFLFKQPFTWLMALGIALIIGGVLLIETGSVH